MMKSKQLESMLDDIDDFQNPRIELEQYSTPAYVAAKMVHTICMDGYIEKKCIVDLGCGPGILSIAAILMGADNVIALDLDENALEIAHENIRNLEMDDSCIELILCDALRAPLHDKICDVVIMNPPFGTKGNKGIDVAFLKAAMNLAKEAIYSLHKSATRNYLLQKGSDLGMKAEILGQFSYDLPATYARHTKLKKTIDVDLIRFSLR
ncbi:methyltransferase like 5 [Brevipalpus obovatus]|uniref:methyltransferase like 5 n=1 Tax=Brevipalpus obovatus TaxID=246614 RepID=UPI003D9F1D64